MVKVRSRLLVVVAVVVGLAMLAAGCGSDDGTGDSGADGRPTIVVTTSILGDVVGELVGDQADVVTLMPVGADPHEFMASAQEVDQLLKADALIVNGADFEEGLLDVIESAVEAGVPTFEATSAVETIDYSDADEGHEEEGHEDEGHEDDAHADEGHDEHGHEGVDPHFFTDPGRMIDAVGGITSFLEAEVEGLDHGALDAATDDYVARLQALDDEIEELLGAIPEEQRVLVTNHEVFGYFADRYGFEVVGVVIPGGSTVDSASAGELAELAEVIEHEGVPAIFADASASTTLADTLAAEVGEVDVVELFSESRGEPGSDGETYLDMVRANATRISVALA